MRAFAKRHPDGIRLFALAFLTLYLELALIRMASAEVLYLGYFSNFVLIAAFLGMGTGFLLAGRGFHLLRYLPEALLFLVAFILLTRIDATYLREHLGQLFFGHGGSPLPIPLWVSLPLLFLTSAFIFACIAQETGRCFPRYPPLVAYSIDIGGSLTGIAAFTLHSYAGGTPLQWLLVAFAVIAFASRRTWVLNAAAMGVAVAVLVVVKEPAHYSRWTPYQRIDVWPFAVQGQVGYHLSANGIGHQTMQRVGTKEPIYDFPYTEVARARGRPFERALVIGAGSGTDTAYALHYGVRHLDAVEIDPEIYRAGLQFHPERPYDDPRVRVHLDDGRAFMGRTRERYDLIVYALPDSLASLSSVANIRLESFLFTRESFQKARALLTDDGALVLYNYYRKPWLVEKLAGMLADVFGHPPVVRVYHQASSLAALAVGPRLGGPPRGVPAPPPATDVWPFLYMERPHLPGMYLWLIALFVGCGAAAVLASGQGTSGAARARMPFLLSGAAFLLLETKSVIQFSLLFGATWLVNALVFAAILASVLAANLVAARLQRARIWLAFALLLGLLALQAFVPLDRLLGIESRPLRYAVASALFFAPVFLANLVFSFLFRDAAESAAAMGWNVLGTTLGGALEYTSIAIGYQLLTGVIAALYAACALWILLVMGLRPVARRAAAG